MQTASLTLQTKNTSGKTLNTKISYVNPQVDNQKLSQFIVKLNSFTTNTFVKTTKTIEETI